MKIKTLLLGSSAVLGVVGAAQAADTPKPAAVMKPAPVVQYVQVCDLYGIGYFALPGKTDTCLRIQGTATFQLNFHTTSITVRPEGTSAGHSAAWSSVATGVVTFTAHRQTDHGDLIGVVRITSNSNNRDTLPVNISADTCTAGPAVTFADGTIDFDPTTPAIDNDPGLEPDVFTPTCTVTGNANNVPLDRYVQMNQAYIQVGSKFSVLMGYNGSVYGQGTTKQVMFDFDLGGGHELQLALDDPRDRWGTRLPSNYWVPDLVGNFTGNYALGTYGVSGGLAWVDLAGAPVYDPAPGTMVWGVSARTTIKADAIAKGDQLTLTAAYGTGCSFVTCTLSSNQGGSNTIFQGTVGFKHVFNTKVNTNTVFQWTNPNNAGAGNYWQITNTTQYFPTNERNFTLQNQLRYAQTLVGTSGCTTASPCHAWTDQVQAQYAF